MIERFGRFNRILTPGLHCIIPIIDSPRHFSWIKTSLNLSGGMEDEMISGYRIDTRETVFNFSRQEVYTKDTILLDVNSIMYYKIVDVKKAIYEVDDLQSAIVNVAQTQLKEVFGSMTLQECMTSQDQINKCVLCVHVTIRHMKEAFLPRFMTWGIKVERMELLDIKPRDSVADSMKTQMIAERDRRSQFIEAEGKKTALRIQSEGTKVTKQNDGLAQQELSRKISEGEAQERIELARAESQSLELVKSALQSHSASQAQYLLAMRYLELLNTIGHVSQNKTIYLPYESDALCGSISTLNRIYGRNNREMNKASEVPKVVEVEEKGEVNSSGYSNFDDLN